MGYCITQEDTDFFIPKDKINSALKAVQDLYGEESIKDGSGKHFSWVGQDFHKLDTFEKIMEEWRWEVGIDESGNVAELQFVGEKAGDDDILFGAIAPFVRKGSYIQVRGEDGCHWQWAFNGTTMDEQYGRVVYE